MPLVTNLMQRLGMLGNADAFTNQLVPPSNNPQTALAMQNAFHGQGEVENPDTWGKYSARMQRPATYDQMLQLWDEMSSWDILAAALTEIVDETLGKDELSPATLWFECSDSEVERDLNENMLQAVNAEHNLASQVWYVSGFGNAMEKLDFKVGEGVTGSSFYHPMDVRRFWLKRNRACAGFRVVGETPDRTNVFSYANGEPIERPSLGTGQTSEPLFYPWEFLHFRRLYRMRMTEHGEPLFDDAQQIYKKLRMAIDQMCVYRAQMQPDRYVVNVDTQNLPPADQMAAVQRWKQSLRSKLSFGTTPNGGEGSDSFKSFYNPWALDTVLFMAKPAGFQHSIEKLQGTSQVPDVYDIELLQNMLFSIIGMPKWWIMGQVGASTPPSGKALLASDIRFLRKVKSIRRPILEGYQWLAYFHCMLKGKDVRNLTIEAKMSPIGSLEDQTKLEIISAQSDALAKYGELLNSFGVPREAWAQMIMDRFLNLPADVINAALVALPVTEMPENVKAVASKAHVMEELERLIPKASPEVERSRRIIREALDGKVPTENRTKYRTPEAILGVSERAPKNTAGQRMIVESGDVVVQSNQNAENIVTESSKVKQVTESNSNGSARPAYWNYGPPKR